MLPAAFAAAVATPVPAVLALHLHLPSPRPQPAASLAPPAAKPAMRIVFVCVACATGGAAAAMRPLLQEILPRLDRLFSNLQDVQKPHQVTLLEVLQFLRAR
jgi:hypothetical protein